MSWAAQNNYIHKEPAQTLFPCPLYWCSGLLTSFWMIQQSPLQVHLLSDSFCWGAFLNIPLMFLSFLALLLAFSQEAVGLMPSCLFSLPATSAVICDAVQSIWNGTVEPGGETERKKWKHKIKALNVQKMAPWKMRKTQWFHWEVTQKIVTKRWALMGGEL